MKRRGFLAGLLGLPAAAKALAELPKIAPSPEPIVEEKVGFNEALSVSECDYCTLVTIGSFGCIDRGAYIVSPYRNR